MATLNDVLRLQKETGILTAPAEVPQARKQTGASRTPPTLTIALRNNTSSSRVYANITGLAINNKYSVFLLQSDGITGYYPKNPDSNQQPLAANCTIALGAPGTTKSVVVPQLAGARIWFSKEQPLTFKLNRGQSGVGLVEPSVSNPTDPSYQIQVGETRSLQRRFLLFPDLRDIQVVFLRRYGSYTHMEKGNTDVKRSGLSASSPTTTSSSSPT